MSHYCCLPFYSCLSKCSIGEQRILILKKVGHIYIIISNMHVNITIHRHIKMCITQN